MGAEVLRAKSITKAQLTAIHTLLHKAGMMDGKRQIIAAYTGGRSDSSRDMTLTEAEQLISYLMKLDPDNQKADKMRKKILSMAHEMGWKWQGRIDMSRVNNWCRKYGYLHKKLDAYTYKELPRLVTQFEGAYRAYISK